MKFLSKMVVGSNMTVIVDGRVLNVSKDHINYNKLLEAYKANDADAFVANYDVLQAVKSQCNMYGKKVSVVDDVVYYNGEVLHSNLTGRMIDMLRNGFDINPMIKFLENLMLNSSKRAVDELYDFLEHKGLSISEDGGFLAYKTVRADFLDKYSGTTDNTPGSVIEMSRNKCDDDRENQCSYGYHVGCLAYSGPGGWYNNSGDKVLIVKVMPQDVVAVPKDHNATKLRCCKYVVVDEFKSELKRPVYSGVTLNDEEYDNDYDDSDYEEDDVFSLDAKNLRVDDVVTFDYKKDFQVKKNRCCLVTDINTVEGFIIGELLFPEEKSGETRRFSFDRMSNIQLD